MAKKDNVSLVDDEEMDSIIEFSDNIADAVLPMLDDGPHRSKLCEDLSAVRRTMGESGAVMRTAKAVLTFARERGIHEAVQ